MPHSAVKGTAGDGRDTDLFRGFGFEVHLPRWATVGVGALVLVGVALTIALAIYRVAVPLIFKPGADAWIDAIASDNPDILTNPVVQKVIYDPTMRDRLDRVHRLVENMISLSQASSHQFDDKYAQFDVPADDLRGVVKPRYYNSDQTIVVLWTPPGDQSPRPHWILRSASKGPKDLAWPSAPPKDSSGPHALLKVPQLPVVHAADRNEMPTPPGYVAQACAGKCFNPHTGQYTQWNGAPNGCFLPVWRRWPEGCQHYQWFNTCSGTWDVNQDGTPRVNWTCCVH